LAAAAGTAPGCSAPESGLGRFAGCCSRVVECDSRAIAGRAFAGVCARRVTIDRPERILWVRNSRLSAASLKEENRVKRIALMFSALALLGSLPLAAETVNGILVDQACSPKMSYDDAKGHSKECAMMDDCKKSGFGVVTADGKFLKFDAAGDKKALEAIEATDKEEGITISVDGTVDGKTIKVTSLKIT
jgi:hypothetical protein